MTRHVDLEALDFRKLVKPGDFVVWGQACGEPVGLTRRLMEQRHRIGAFEAFIGISLSDTVQADHADCVRFSSFCATGRNGRLAAIGKLDILPLHYSRLADRLRQKVDVLLLQIAERPGGHGYTLAASCDYVQALIPHARVVVAELNRQAPVSDIPIDPARIDVIVPTDHALPSLAHQAASPVNRQIASHVAALVDDGATMQFGLGATPECVAALLLDRKHLGLHTGVMSDAAMALIRSGAIDNSRKPFDKGISIAGGLLGSSSLLEFADANPGISLRPTDYTHDIGRLAALPRFIAVNSALEVDLSGQANTESLGGRYIGAIGGAVDFSRGAHASHGGLPIIALTATARRGTAPSPAASSGTWLAPPPSAAAISVLS